MSRSKSLLWLFGLALCFCLALYLKAEEKNDSGKASPLIPRALLFGNPEKTSAKISPDGKKLAYLAPDASNVLNVWVRDLETKNKDRQVTADSKRGIRQFFWQLDNASILYIQDKDGDENGHLYQTGLETLETRDLTPFEGVKVGMISADSHFSNELLIGLNKRDPKLFDVYRLDLQTGELQLDTENPGGIVQWVADHNLQIRASAELTEDGSTLIRVRNDAKSSWRDWLVIDSEEIGDIEGFSADNQKIFLITSLGSDKARLLQIDVETGEQELLVEDPDYDLSGLQFHPVDHSLEAVTVEKEKNEWILIDPAFASEFQKLSELLKTPFAFASRDLADQHWIIISLSDVRPSHFYLYRRLEKKLEFLFSTQPALESYSLSPMEPIRFQSRDGLTLHGYLSLPHGLAPRNLPAVLLVHGGPWVRDSWGIQPQVQWFANRGYAVLQINYRGSTGYGKAFLNAGDREWAGKMHDDLLDGKEWLIRRGYADPDKIAIVGGSYGGYATLVGLTFTPDAFCCGVDIVGPSNLITLLETFPPYWKPLKKQMDRRVGRLEDEQEFLKSRSPLYKAAQIKKPLLIAQGANDPRVKQAESDQIVFAMRQNQLPVEYLLFLDEGHGFVRPENRLKFYAAAEAFLAKYLGGRSEPPSIEENWESLKR